MRFTLPWPTFFLGGPERGRLQDEGCSRLRLAKRTVWPLLLHLSSPVAEATVGVFGSVLDAFGLQELCLWPTPVDLQFVGPFGYAPILS